MSKEKKFAIGISNGMKIDLETGYEDMPEGVRAYLEEVARQLEEEGEDGTFTIDDRNVPPEVDAYFRKKVLERIEAGRADVNTVKVAEYPPDAFEKLIDKAVLKTARSALADAKDGGEEEAVRRMAFYLRGAFRLLFANSEEWNELGVVTAAKLYDDVSAVMLHLAADFHRLADAAGKVPMEPEEDGEEEADSDDEDAE